MLLQEPDDLFETISQALLNAVDRDAISGWGAVVHIMWVIHGIVLDFLVSSSLLGKGSLFGITSCIIGAWIMHVMFLSSLKSMYLLNCSQDLNFCIHELAICPTVLILAVSFPASLGGQFFPLTKVNIISLMYNAILLFNSRYVLTLLWALCPIKSKYGMLYLILRTTACIVSTPFTLIVEPPIKDPPRKGQPPNKGCNSGTLSHSSSSFLTSEKRTTSTEDKITGPKMSFIRRFHCIACNKL